MRVHLIKEKTLREFVAERPQSKVSIEDWIFKVKVSNWQKPNDILLTFSTADLLGRGSSRVVFDI